MRLQFIVDGVVSGAVIGLGAVGVTLTYSILRFANFAHGEFISWGAYFTLLLAGALGFVAGRTPAPIGPFSFTWPILLAGFAAMLLTGGLALALDRVLFRPLRRTGEGIVAVMASFGASLALRSLIEATFTSRPAYFTRALQIAKPLGLGVRVTPNQAATVVAAAFLVGATHFLLTHTRMGRAMRATAENPSLARVNGIDVEGGDPGDVADRRRIGRGVRGHCRPARPGAALDGLRLVAAAVRCRHRRWDRLGARRRAGRLDRRADRGRGGCVRRRAVARCRRVRHPDRRPARPSWRPVRTAALMLDLVSYAAFFATTALTYAVICLGLNVQWGQTGLFNVGIAGFVAIGAYASAILTTPPGGHLGGFGLSIAVGWFGAMLASAAASVFVGALTMRLRADYLAITTFGIAVTVPVVLPSTSRASPAARSASASSAPVRRAVHAARRCWAWRIWGWRHWSRPPSTRRWSGWREAHGGGFCAASATTRRQWQPWART